MVATHPATLRGGRHAHPRRQSEHHPLDDGEDRRGGEGRSLAWRRGHRRQSRFGPASIEGYFDEAFSVPGLIEEIGKAREADAFIIACFDDTGLDAARCATEAPVIGIGEAAFHMASLVAAKFSVVTTLSRSIIPIEHNLAKYGLIARCARVRAAEVPVLALEEPGSKARVTIEKEIARALAEDGAEAIVLGCAGMTDLARDLSRKAGVPVLDGVACAVALAESLVRIGLRTRSAGLMRRRSPSFMRGSSSAFRRSKRR